MAAATPHPPVLGELLNPRQKFVILLSLMLAMFVSALNQTIVATATPQILADLGGFHLIAWVFTVYLLASTVVVPVVGKLSDMFGRKPFILAGIAIFITGSAACGAATSMPLLIAGRGVQGIGGGVLFGSVFTTMGDLYTPIERGKYMGFMISGFTIASITGPAIGGFLTDGPGWRWCFYLNIPVGLAAAYVISRNLPMHSPGGRLDRIDFIGAVLLTASTVLLLLGLVWANKEFGWAGPETVGIFAVGAVLLALFLLQERRHPEAILPLYLFRNRVFVQGNFLQIFQSTGQMGTVQYLPIFIQTGLGASATASGLVSTPMSLASLATTVLGGQLVARTGRFKYQIIAGASLTLVGVTLLYTLNSSSPEWHIAAFMVVMGLGSGLIGPTIGVITQSAVSTTAIGVATSARQFSMQIGGVVAVAIFGVLFTSTYVSSFERELGAEAAALVPPAVYEEFKDPTLVLDDVRYATATEALLAESGGEALVAGASHSQREGVTSAMRQLFLISIVLASLGVLTALTMPEIELRRTFGDAPQPKKPDDETVAATPLAEAEAG